ncbi:MAG: hypothetical protein PHH24_02230, partial [Candidatus Moranbacteria bacterium]|jgi:hypothetical protein|nr:hypothetical protein [Candidatus Moranbacteria bacterium]MDD5651843.1 hypothetical protein [Candidatus Moranbacteria bacterium]MDX9855441.1 hypothetical protein [Candidatus Moranbacteria bacterium]
MSDEKTTNLEPIDEGDMDLAEKFGHIEKQDIDKEKKPEKESPVIEKKEKAGEKSPAEKDDSYSKILSKVKKTSDDDEASIAGDAKDVSLKTDADSQIQHLVDLAMNKSITHAVKVAKHLEDNYVLDMFHDKLISDELHDALKEKGIIN